jgi:trigger factor
MRATSEVLEENKVRLAIEIDADEVETSLASTAKTLAREVRIPGFRPGRAPRQVLEARIGGPKALRDEALRELLPDYYARALSATEVEPISAPELKVTSGEDEGAVGFDAIVEVRPTLSLVGYDKLRVTIPSPVATDGEVDALLDRLRDTDATLEDVSRPIVTGDHVTMDVRGTIAAGEGTGSEIVNVDDYVYVVGQGTLVDAADDQLPGMRAGEVLDVTGTAPGGMQLRFVLTLKQVREKHLPELTDEWVTENSEFETAQELRDNYVGRIQTMKVEQAKRGMRDATFLELSGQIADDDVPASLVELETRDRFDEFARSLEAAKMTYEDYFRVTHQDPEEFAEMLRLEGAKSAKVDLALRAVAAAEQLEPTDEVMAAELERLAKSVKRSTDKLREDLERSGRFGALRGEKAKSLAADYVLEHATYVDPEGAEIDRTLLEDDDEPIEDGALDQNEDDRETTEDQP